MKTNYRPYQLKTGEPCSCKRGIERDNCPACEGTGWRIDFRAIHNARTVNLDSKAWDRVENDITPEQ